MEAIEMSLYIMNGNILTIAREATAAMATKNLTGMHALAARIKRCQESVGKDCYIVAGVCDQGRCVARLGVACMIHELIEQ